MLKYSHLESTYERLFQNINSEKWNADPLKIHWTCFVKSILPFSESKPILSWKSESGAHSETSLRIIVM